MSLRALRIFGLVVLLVSAAFAAEQPGRKAPTMAEVLAASKSGDWRELDPENTIYVELDSGRVVIGDWTRATASGPQRHAPRAGGPGDGVAVGVASGTGALGFYEKSEQRVAIKAIRVAADVPEAERSALEVMRTDTRAFRELVESRRNRREDWFHAQAGHIELCNVPIPVRLKSAGAR
jgi:hypothetical protein